MLRDKRVAIVAVEGRLPVGVREGQSFDVTVRALEHNNTRSLAHGDLYQTDLSDLGLYRAAVDRSAAAGVRAGGAGVCESGICAERKRDHPAGFAERHEFSAGGDGPERRGSAAMTVRSAWNLRRPQVSTARLIEQIISQRWQAPTQMGMVHGDGSDIVAKAENEGLVLVYVPPQYKGNWKHFLGVVSHLYLNQSPEFLARKSRELVRMAGAAGRSAGGYLAVLGGDGRSGVADVRAADQRPESGRGVRGGAGGGVSGG